ncbi:hypothetical protein ACIHDR_04045 [Nocardia sp. NPDC052278]|uniref:hypothetical protein n=1 Tax=unclassified Nocardia TaxID=2637762 RepID=UPI0036A327DE
MTPNKSHRPRTFARLLAATAAAIGSVFVLSSGTATADADQYDVDQYLGTWNYVQPDFSTGTNIAVMQLPGLEYKIPQIGTVVFEREPGGVVGRTDQGCTWHFTPKADGLDLSSKDQYCFNKVIGSGYNIDTWHVSARGKQEEEVVHATSDFNGGQYPFVLDKGSRTKAGIENPRDTLEHFIGTWTYDPADPTSGINLLNPQRVPKTGTVTFTPGDRGQIKARTDDGCAWTLAVDGNTAELSRTPQQCGAQTINFWSIASDGHHEFAIINGIDAQGKPYLLSIGSLTKTS